ncbi:MAG TPA: hypothetical protein VHE35_15235 [Kofleriaceae bacterium]|nr:hypothetical protein [Kofleriaceae bacterium]
MPTPSELLAGLTTIANDAMWMAIAWHVVLLAAIVALAVGWHPRKRSATLGLAAPLASASALAFAHGNPFNGVLLGAATLTLGLFALRGDNEEVAVGAPWETLVAGMLLGFAWTYPHFLERGGWLAYLYAAPVGLVPCPTLSLALGFALLGGGIDRRVAAVLAAFGLFYGLFGVVRLGVRLDLGLVAGATAALTIALRPTHPPIREPALASHVLS